MRYNRGMFTFTLPSGAEVDIDGVVEAMLGFEEYPQYYLDTELGAIVRIASQEMLRRWIEEIGESDRYFLIPHMDDEERVDLAERFVEVSMKGEVDAQALRGARSTLSTGGSELFALYLEDELPEYAFLWEQFQDDNAWLRAHEWLVDEHIGAEAKFEGCGQCPLCEALAREDRNPEALLDAFVTEEVMEQVGRQVSEMKRMRTVVAPKKMTSSRSSPDTRSKKGAKTTSSSVNKNSQRKRSTKRKKK